MLKIQTGFLYSHFDSRGGSTVVLRESEQEANKAYADDFGLTNKDHRKWLIKDDRIRSLIVLFDPDVLSENENRDIGYRDDDQETIAWALVDESLVEDDEDPEEVYFEGVDVEAIAVCRKQDLPIPSVGYNWYQTWCLGEDAFGLIVK